MSPATIELSAAPETCCPAHANHPAPAEQAPPAVAQSLIGSDQCHDRAERHLEARPEQAFGRDRQHHHGSPGDQAERQRAAVQEDAEQHQADHHKGALGRHRGTGQGEIGKGTECGCRGGPLLDRITERKRRHQREQRPDAEKQQPRHQTDV